MLFFCVDGLAGFSDAIHAVYPYATVQRCVIHMLRNSFKYVSYKDPKAFSADFKAVYRAEDEQAALFELELVKEKWGKKYPYAIQNWETNWTDVSSFFQFTSEIRTIMYTTNTIEGFNRQLRKVTKSKSIFPTDDSLLKMLYLAMLDITKKWTQSRRDWGLIHSQLEIYFSDRIR